jgi:T-complex protein 1 subunit beta
MATIQPRGPVQIFKDNTEEDKKENARLTSFMGAVAVADLVRTTLGPKGMDKILQSTDEHGEIQITNDGATILKSLFVDNPAAKVIIDISKTQDDEVGDGTTSVVVLAGELLREADKLTSERKIHPQIIIDGWRSAVGVARSALQESSMDLSESKDGFRENLKKLARTTLSSKILGHGYKEHFAEIAVRAVEKLKGSTNLDNIHIIKKVGGSAEESFLDEGFILEKKIGVGQPKRIENAKILIANTPMDNDKIKIFGAKVVADSPEQVALIEKAERERMLAKCQKIIDHGINVFINRQLIYNLPEQFFGEHGIMAIEHADFEGVERLALVTGSEIVSTFDDPKRVKLGHCKLIEEVMIGEDRMIRFSGVERGEACTIVLRGPTEHFLNEAERSMHDVLCVLSQTVATEKRTTLGGGCAEAIMAKAVDELAKRTPGKKKH